MIEQLSERKYRTGSMPRGVLELCTDRLPYARQCYFHVQWRDERNADCRRC